jgi:hypothetical protein
VIKFHDARRALWRIWSRTNRYIYSDRYIKIILYYLYLHHSRFKKKVLKSDEMFNCLSYHVLLYSDIAIGTCVYEVIDMHCSSHCYVGGNDCICKYKTIIYTFISVYDWCRSFNSFIWAKSSFTCQYFRFVTPNSDNDVIACLPFQFWHYYSSLQI